MQERARLRLIESREAVEEFGLVPQGDGEASAPLESNLAQPMLRRPGDHVELLWLEPTAELKALRLAATQRGLHPDTAVAIVIERRLAVAELRSQSNHNLIEWLDRRSEERRPETELWSAHAAYLGHLLRGTDRRVATSAELSSSRVALPIRIIDRVGRRIPDAVESTELDLSRAVSWEVAAMLGGETLSEWAYRLALSQFRSSWT